MDKTPPPPLPVKFDPVPFQKRLAAAIFRVSEKVQSQYRHRLDAYIRHVSPAFKDQGDSNLPDAVRRHPRHPDRAGSWVYPGLLYFHVGNAVITFYDCCLGTAKASDLERRIALLEKFGKYGQRGFDVIGSEAEGFELVHHDDKPVPFLAPGGRNDERNTETL